MITLGVNRGFKRVAGLLHKSAALRRAAKLLARHLTLTQAFHGGRIAFNAVDHSWAWTGLRNYENFDRELQDRLLELSIDRSRFLDIGANVGAMTLAVLLRNRTVTALAVEPNSDAVSLMRQSILLNHLENRCTILNVAVSAGESRLGFDSSGSVMGHVSAGGPGVDAVDLVEIVRQTEDRWPLLVKIDVEGYESALIPALRRIAPHLGSCAVVELHPLGFNGLGDPQRCLECLRSDSGLSVRALGGAPLGQVDSANFTQIEVHWP